MIKVFTLFFSILLLNQSCRSIRNTDLQVAQGKTIALPITEITFDWSSFEDLDRDNSFNDASYYYSSNSQLQLQSYSSTIVELSHSDDLIALIEDDFKKNMVDPQIADNSGSITFTIDKASLKKTGVGFRILSILSLTTLNYVGLPAFNYQSEIELFAVIKDCNQNEIVTIKKKGTAKVPVAMYHGYNNKNGRRKAYLEATNNSLHLIKNDLRKQKNELVNQLEKCKL